MPLTLRPYQLQAVAEARAKIAAGHRRLVVVAPTGAGKSVVLAHIAQRAASLSNRLLVLAHRVELVEQLSQKLDGVGLNHGIIQGSHWRRMPNLPVQVASVPTLCRREALPDADLLAVDECFPGDTMVGGRPIRAVLPGDLVPSFDELTGSLTTREVLHVFARTPVLLVKVYLAKHPPIVCTWNHPLRTRLGWTPAGRLNGNDELLIVRRPSNRDDTSPEDLPSTDRQALLLESLLDQGSIRGGIPNHDGDESALRFRTNEGTEPNAPAGNATEDVGDPQDHPASTPDSRRKRTGLDGSTAATGDGPRVADGVRPSDRNTEGSRDGDADPLQAGPGRAGNEGVHRSGRGVALLPEGPGGGREEEPLLDWTRVDRVEVLEPGSDGTFGGLCPGGLVYNLEVEGTHIYVADGVVAHNCHHVPSASFRKIVEAYPRAIVLGFSATPYRLDGRGLGEFFDDLVVVSQIPELIAEGYLVPPLVFAPSEPDVSMVRSAAGDYNRRDLAIACDKPTLIGDVVETWRARATGRSTVVFAVSIEHSRHLVETFKAAGISAEHVDADTPAKERAAILARGASGETTVLSNVGILTEGWDLPRLECVVMARPTQSRSLFRQMIGRGLRTWGAKRDCLVLDHAGNVYRHGLPTEPEEFSLAGCRRRKGDAVPSVRTCPLCLACAPGGATVCPACGNPFPERKRPLIVKKGNLSEVGGETWQSRTTPDRKVELYVRWYRIEKERKYKKGYAACVYRAAFGAYPDESLRARAAVMVNV